MIGCTCKDEERHGETSIMCCNHCGLPTEKFWTREEPSEVDSISLTHEELSAAIHEGKVKKFFHERNKDKWPADAYELKNKKQ